MFGKKKKPDSALPQISTNTPTLGGDTSEQPIPVHADSIQPATDTSGQNQPAPTKDDVPYVQPPPPAYSQGDNQKGYESQRQTMVTPLVRLGEEPANVDCPYCRNITQTRVSKTDSSMTMIAGILIGCICICLACLPCCLGSCADVDHHCTNCGNLLTHRPYDGQTQVLSNLPQNMVPSQYTRNQALHQQTVTSQFGENQQMAHQQTVTSQHAADQQTVPSRDDMDRPASGRNETTSAQEIGTTGHAT